MSFEDLVGRWPKVCLGCETPWNEPEWSELALVSESTLGHGARVELRRCHCGEIIGAAVSDDSARAG